MTKDEVVGLMTKAVNDINYQFGLSTGMSEKNIRDAIDAHQEQLIFVNNSLYDILKINGVIA
jgi:hypothetical protein